MLKVSANEQVIDVVRLILEKDDRDIRFYDDTLQKEQQISGDYLLQSFAAGCLADSTVKSLCSGVVNRVGEGQGKDKWIDPSMLWLISIFDSLHDGVLIADNDVIVRYINKSFERISGAEFSTIVGRYLLDVRPGARLGEVIRSGKPMFGVRRKFGDIEYMTDMHPLIINGECRGGVTVARDITEIQQLQTKLKNYRVRFTDLLRQMHKENSAIYTFNDIWGHSPRIQAAKLLAKKLAPSNLTVLLRGESGTGKELFAHAIHLESPRHDEPFVTVNCAAIPGPLLESELFGYSEGAFSGAKQSGKMGLIMLADRGTLFLDEIGDMNIELQSKLLRVLQTGEVQPLGDVSKVKVDVRIVAATNANLEQHMLNGKFREDLFYRLNISQVHIPPLREWSEDIVALAEAFLSKCINHHLGALELDQETKAILTNYNWPGNVRELENAIRFIANITEHRIITPDYLPQVFFQHKVTSYAEKDSKKQREVPNGTSLKEKRFEAERETILATLEKTGWNVPGKKEAAKQLGISLTTLYARMNYHAISPTLSSIKRGR